MNKSSRKNPSPLKAFTHGPRFAAGLCPLLRSLVLLCTCILLIVPRQQVSFGRNRRHVLGGVVAGELQLFAEARAVRERSGAKILQPASAVDLQRKGPCGKEASLLT